MCQSSMFLCESEQINLILTDHWCNGQCHNKCEQTLKPQTNLLHVLLFAQQFSHTRLPSPLQHINTGGFLSFPLNKSHFFLDCVIVFVCYPCCPGVTVLCVLHCIRQQQRGKPFQLTRKRYKVKLHNLHCTESWPWFSISLPSSGRNLF